MHSPVDSARNLGVIFDKNLSFAQHITAFSNSCLCNIRAPDQTTVCTIATSLFQSKIDYCHSLSLNLHATQTNRLQIVLNYAARAVTKSPKFHHNTPILKSLNWLKINERIKYQVLSLTYKSLKIGQPSYLRSLLSFPSHCSTRSSSLFTQVTLLSPLVVKLEWDLSIILLMFVEQFPNWSTSRYSSRHSFNYIKLICLWYFNLSLS